MALSFDFVYGLWGGNTSYDDVAFLLQIEDQGKTEGRVSSKYNWETKMVSTLHS